MADIVLGIDEAGRGPVIGPMVYACAYWKKKDEEEILKKFKFADSKVLTEKIREEIYNEMSKSKFILDYEAKIIDPIELSNKMLKRIKISLNKISTDAACELIKNTINRGLNITEVYVDTVGPAESYQNLLQNKFNNIKFTVCPKADSKYAVVSAASIVAKVTRDREVKNWKFVENKPIKLFDNSFGSGYPSDPHAKKWMSENCDEVFGYPSNVRFSWKTTTNMMQTNTSKIIWENYEEEVDDKINKQPFIKKENNNLFFIKETQSKYDYLKDNQIKITNIKLFD